MAVIVLVIPDAATVEAKVQRAGTLQCDPPTTPALAVGDVRVTVCVRLDTKPFVNGLSPFGIDVSN